MQKFFSKKMFTAIFALVLSGLGLLLADMGGKAHAHMDIYTEAQMYMPVEITPNMYDSYTDDDIFYYNSRPMDIDQYPTIIGQDFNFVKQYFDNCDFTVDLLGDDPIVSIVPRELFIHRGEYLYVGKEYGFYVKTDKVDDYAFDSYFGWPVDISFNESDVFVFNIKNTITPDDPNTPNQLVVEVQPLFQYSYIYVQPQDMNAYTVGSLAIQYNPEQPKGYVVPKLSYIHPNVHYYQLDRYNLMDISFEGALYNENMPNQYEDCYSAAADNGAFFTAVNYEYASAIYDDRHNPVNATLRFIVGFVPNNPYGWALDVWDGVDLATDWYQYYEKEQYLLRSSSESNHLQSMFTTKARQLEHYGTLRKHAAASLPSGSLRLGTDNTVGNYVKCTYTFSETEEWRTNFLSTIQLSVGTDRAKLMTSVSSYDFSFNNRQSKTIYVDSPAVNVSVLKGGNDIIEFRPEYSGTYIFEASHKSANMYVRSGSSSIAVTTEHIGGKTVFNALLKENQMYMLDIRLTQGYFGTFTFVAMSQTVGLGSNTLKLIRGNNIFSFVPTSSDVYQLETDGHLICEKLKSYEGTSISGIYLAGSTYFFKVHCSTDTALSNINISAKALLSLNNSDDFDIDSGETVYFKYKNTTGAQKDISLTLSWQGSLDPSDYPYANFYNASLGTLSVISPGTTTCKNYLFTAAADQTIYLAITGSVSHNISMTLQEKAFAYEWFVDGQKVDNEANLKRNNSYNISLHVKTHDGFSEFTELNSVTSPYYTVSAGTLTISPDCPIYSAEQISPLLLTVSSINDYFPLIVKVAYDDSFFYNVVNDRNNDGDTMLAVSCPGINQIEFFLYLSKSGNTYSGKTANYTFNMTTDTNISILPYLTNAQDNMYVHIVSIRIGAKVLQNDIDFTIADINFDSAFGGHISLTSSVTEYRIYTRRHLENLKFSKTGQKYILCRNILLTGEWVPIERFYGTLEGGACRIENLTITIPSIISTISASYGFFKENYGVINSLRIYNISIYAENHSAQFINVGGICGENYGIINKCYISTGYQNNRRIEINRYNSSVGSIVGRNYCEIIDCSNYAEIYCSGNAGGISGDNYGIISYCKNLAKISYYYMNENKCIGNIVGEQNNSGLVKGCENRGSVSYVREKLANNKELCPYIGIFAGKGGEVENCFCPSISCCINRGTLYSFRYGFLWLQSHDQAKNVEETPPFDGNIYLD